MALPWFTLELELRIIPGLRKIVLKAPQEISGDPPPLGRFLKKNHSGDRFAVDPLRYRRATRASLTLQFCVCAPFTLQAPMRPKYTKRLRSPEGRRLKGASMCPY